MSKLSSQESLPDSPLQTARNVSDLETLSSTSVELSSDDEIDEDSGIKDKILTRTLTKRSLASTESEEKIAKRNHSSNSDGSISLRKFDLGQHYDPDITTSIEKINSLKEQMVNNQAQEAGQTSPLALRKKKIRQLLKKPNVSSSYIDMIAKETISQKYVDWHFITEDSTFVQSDSSLRNLIRSFGVSDLKIQALYNDRITISKARQYDTLCELTPVKIMMDTLLKYKDDSLYFLKSLICFIMDRKVYESVECDVVWCTRVFNMFPESKFLTCYLQLVNNDDYFMHYRLMRLIPSLRCSLLKCILCKSPDIPFLSELTSVFDDLLDAKSYETLLYYILVVVGPDGIPFGDNKCIRYFEKCISDILDLENGEVELTLLKGILNMFRKI
ncbi:hypothetical protein HG535_0B02670 [Zygotorulaspora mrakii]|uniref:Uncharacterized protein n=1 Tax=Zygotorulaspora mrakii TaxID=42260 RepID=A0A7H9AXT7_ZYGMR|nr:uncharacterized protein HG535_0B02670 [Zygotorulaspora mrakii]QLG71228.1 hypothetical protein HG535_0B02670 [Zygotorulaspora mrakii]